MRPFTFVVVTAVLVVAAPARAQTPCTRAVAACERWITFAGGPARSMVYANYALDGRNTAITRALIMVHGAGRNADHYFETSIAAAFLAGALDNTIIIAPHFIAVARQRDRQMQRLVRLRDPAEVPPGERSRHKQHHARSHPRHAFSSSSRLERYRRNGCF